MAVEQESNNSPYSGPPIDRNGFHYILSRDLLFYLFGGLYTRNCGRKSCEDPRVLPSSRFNQILPHVSLFKLIAEQASLDSPLMTTLGH